MILNAQLPLKTAPKSGIATGAPILQIAPTPSAGTLVDTDHNGIPDELEMRLAQEFAPILFYEASEPNRPTSVDRFLQNVELWFFSKNCSPQHVLIGKLTGRIPRRVMPDCRDPQREIDSQGTRSITKQSTFYLQTVPEAERGGNPDTQSWVTYVHAFRNDIGGITVQFWRFYPYNTGYFLGLRSENGSHGGDWEGIHVVLQAGEPFVPVKIRLLGHSDLMTRPWSEVITENGHALIRCSKGSHTSILMTRDDLTRRSRFIEQESWAGGSVRWSDGHRSKSGPLIRLGQKTYPSAGQEWLQYSGLWGSREDAGLFSFYRSGYWGPAFNETGMGKDGFISAWCEGIARPQENSPTAAAAFRGECYPASVSQ